jgi:hypothetical protein
LQTPYLDSFAKLLRFIRRKRTSWLQKSGHAVPIEG